MTQFKKCESDYCDNRATKMLKVFTGYDDKIGGWKSRIYDGPAGRQMIRTQRKYVKVRVCDVCYETAEPSDFTFTDAHGQPHTDPKRATGCRIEQI